MNIGELLTHKIPSVNTNSFSNVNPANRVFSFRQIKVQKVIQLPRMKFINVHRSTTLASYTALSRSCKNKR